MRDNDGQRATCKCGKITFDIEGAPIVHARCYCDSCRTAGLAFAEASDAPSVVGADGGTGLVLYRKDRIGVVRGGGLLHEHRLKPESATRRMVTSCCGMPMFLEFTKGHWLSVYADCLSDPVPDLEMRVMTADRPDGRTLPDDVPNYATHSLRFMLKLLGAWARMGFRRPEVTW